MNLHRQKPSAFTLIEMMLAVLLMGLLASAVTLSFSQPLNASRTADAIDLIKSFDNTGRYSATSCGRNVRLVFDLSQNTLVQHDGADLSQLRTSLLLPQGCRLDAVRVDGQEVLSGEAMVDISPHGWSKTYSLHLLGPASDRWLVFAGMSGQMTEAQNESQIPIFHAPARHDAD